MIQQTASGNNKGAQSNLISPLPRAIIIRYREGHEIAIERKKGDATLIQIGKFN